MNNFHNNIEQQRFELIEAGQTAYATYRESGSALVIPHVEAPLALRGTGAAGRLLERVVAEARRRQLKIVPVCSYAAAWFRRHPEFSDVVE